MFSERDEKTADVIETSAPTLDDVYMTAAELAARWRCDTRTLDNLRARGEGLPFIKRGQNGGILYKVADVLACEARGSRGFSWSRFERAVDTFAGFRTSQDRAKFIDHMRAALKD